jgi:hypothetical protein
MRKILTALFAIAFFSASAQALAGQTVEIKSNITSGQIFGNSTDTDLASGSGNSSDMPASYNTVNTNGHSVKRTIYGGRYRATDENVNGNTVNVTVNGEDVKFEGYVVGGWAGSAEANCNTVNISGGKFDTIVYGGYSSKTAENNSVNIAGGSFNSKIYGSYSMSGKAEGSTVNIAGGSFKGDIYGGYSDKGEAAGNMVNISGGVFNGKSIYGGYSDSGKAGGNTVNISGSPDLKNAGLYGGLVKKSPGSSENNTLNLYSRTTVKEMRYFQNINFYLPAEPGDGAMLTVTGDAHITGAIVGVGINGASSPLRVGDTIKLIKAGDLIGAPPNDSGKAIGLQGVTLQYEFDIGVEGDTLFATVTADDPRVTGGSGGVTVTSRAKALSEGLSANITAINSGGDLISGGGVMKTPRGSSSEIGSYTFGVTNFGKSRYKTGSHVDSDTLSILAGIKLAEVRLSRAAVSRGIFAEAGWNGYGTFNDFGSSPGVRGAGESNYFGGGLTLRADYGGSGKGWFYNDAAIRFGRARNSFACDGGTPVSYKTDSPYYGGHIGLGYVRELKNGARLDIGARLLWTRLEGDSVTLQTKDPITFARSDSLRARAGARYDTKKFHAGLAYEYEFAGDANATAYGFPIPAPSLKGGTGICELGFTLGKKNAPFNADVSVSAFTGKREGFAAGIDLNWKF